MTITLATSAAAFTGAFFQRLSGIGFSLLAAPLLVIANGPQQGIRLVNSLTLVVSVTVLISSAKDIDVVKAKRLVPAGVLGALPGLALSRVLPSGPLEVTVGAIIGFSLTAIILTPDLRISPRMWHTVVAGAASGFTSATAGAGGPALAVYAVATRWPQKSFAATAQISFSVQAAVALGVRGLPQIAPHQLGIVLLAVLSGLVLGQFATGLVLLSQARRVAVVLAALATASTIIVGIRAL